MKHGEDEGVHEVGCPPHCPWRWLTVGEFRSIFWRKNADDEGPQVGDEHTGSRVQSGSHHEEVECESGEESDHHQSNPGNAEGKPENEQEVQVGHDESMKMRNLVQHIHLHQDEQCESDNIFYKVTQSVSAFTSFNLIPGFVEKPHLLIVLQVFHHENLLQVLEISGSSNPQRDEV